MRTTLLGLALAFGLAGAASADPLLGSWRTAADDNGHSGLIEVTVCGRSLCGELVGAFDENGNPMQSPNIGRLIIWDTNPTQGGDYVGRVYSPDRDEEYDSRLVLTGDSLSVSGCRRGLRRAGVPRRRCLDTGELTRRHSERLVRQGRHCRKFAISRRPARWLFSGWNCVPMTVSRATMAVTGPP